jgi:predicted RNase H-like HicB family nuclease
MGFTTFSGYTTNCPFVEFKGSGGLVAGQNVEAVLYRHLVRPWAARSVQFSPGVLLTWFWSCELHAKSRYGHVHLPITLEREGRKYWAYSEDFPGVYGLGNSTKEAKTSILEAMRLYIEERRGTRQRIASHSPHRQSANS